jgi:uncharacterized protein YbcI
MAEERLSGGPLAAAISRAIVRRTAAVSGRGPGRARTTIGRDAVFVVVEDALTVAERELIKIGDEETVLRVRHGLQRAMHEDLDADVERLTGRTVIGFMSTNHVDPDLGVEVFILAPEAGRDPAVEGDSGT